VGSKCVCIPCPWSRNIPYRTVGMPRHLLGTLPLVLACNERAPGENLPQRTQRVVSTWSRTSSTTKITKDQGWNTSFKSSDIFQQDTSSHSRIGWRCRTYSKEIQKARIDFVDCQTAFVGMQNGFLCSGIFQKSWMIAKPFCSSINGCESLASASI
jgi:hypothetical protein